VFVGVFFLFILFTTPIEYSSILVDNDGIQAYQFGRVWKSLKWLQIRRIVRVNEYDPPFRSFVKHYYISDSEKRQSFQWRRLFANTKYGSLVFSDKIVDVGDLLNIVSEYANRYNIEIFSVDRPKNARDAIEREQKVTRL